MPATGVALEASYIHLGTPQCLATVVGLQVALHEPAITLREFAARMGIDVFHLQNWIARAPLAELRQGRGRAAVVTRSGALLLAMFAEIRRCGISVGHSAFLARHALNNRPNDAQYFILTDATDCGFLRAGASMADAFPDHVSATSVRIISFAKIIARVDRALSFGDA